MIVGKLMLTHVPFGHSGAVHASVDTYLDRIYASAHSVQTSTLSHLLPMCFASLFLYGPTKTC